MKYHHHNGLGIGGAKRRIRKLVILDGFDMWIIDVLLILSYELDEISKAFKRHL